MSTAMEEEVPAPLNTLRCRTCGTIMGYTAQHTADLTLWCSYECRDVPLSENNPRDELMVEMQAEGEMLSVIARTFGITRQAVAQIIDRRTGKRTKRKQEQPSKEEVVAAKRVMILPRRGRLKP